MLTEANAHHMADFLMPLKELNICEIFSTEWVSMIRKLLLSVGLTLSEDVIEFAVDSMVHGLLNLLSSITNISPIS
jgi:hypothetical protein